MIKELTGGGIKISEATICNIIKEASKKSIGELEKIKKNLLSSPVLHVDETPIRAEGKLTMFTLPEMKNIPFFPPPEQGAGGRLMKLMS